MADIRDHGAAVLGLGVAFLVALGLRSGSRGGPLSLEAADVRIVLLAPIGRHLALRAPALHQVRSAAFGRAVRRRRGRQPGRAAACPGRFAGWVVSGAGFGLLAALLAVGAALVACGLRLSRPAGTGARRRRPGLVGRRLAAGTATSPLTRVGRIGLAAVAR